MRKLAWFSGGFALAVGLCQYWIPAHWALWVALLCALLALLAVAALKGNIRMLCALLLAGMALGGGWNTALCRWYLAPADALDAQTDTYTLTAVDYGVPSAYGTSVTCRLSAEGRSIRTQLFLSEQTEVVPGDRLTLEAALSSTAGQGERYESYPARGIFLLARQKGDTVTLTHGTGRELRWMPKRLAHSLKGSIDAAFPAESAALVKAVITGDRSSMTPALYARIQNAGLAHTVVVSGMHMSYLVAMLHLFTHRRRRAALLGFPVILCFMAMTGFTPSVTRAGIMSILALLGPALDRESDTPTALAFSLMLLLAVNPFSARSISLQLSYASVAGILLFTDRIQTGLRRHLPRRRLLRRPLQMLYGSLSVSLGAMALTTPLIAVYFGRVVLLAPLANLLALWALSLIFLLGMLVGILGLLWPAAAGVLALLPHVLALYFCAVARWVGGMTFAVLTMSNEYLRIWLWFAYGVILVLICQRRWGRWLVVPLSGLCITLAAAMVFSEAELEPFEMTVADVGQGQCVVLRMEELTAVIDCGGTALGGEAVRAVECLSVLGRSRIDYLILTHLHRDHAGDVPLLLELAEVGCLLLPENTDDSDGLLEPILAAAAAGDVTVCRVTEQQTISVPSGTLTLYPPLASGQGNEQCLSVLASRSDFDVLITGDLDVRGELYLTEQYSLPQTEVLVVGHHGSSSSTGEWLLDTVRPQTAVISVGAYNTYGHPSGEVLTRLNDRDITIYRTDRMGDVRITCP